MIPSSLRVRVTSWVRDRVGWSLMTPETLSKEKSVVPSLSRSTAPAVE